ncbi:VOC family protein [Gordonia sp. NPDC003424]
MTGPPTMHHVGITVLDLEKMCRWYADAFAMSAEFAFEIGEVGLRGAVLRAPSGFGVELIAREGGRPGRSFTGPLDAAVVTGHTHVAVRVEDLPAVHERLLAAGGAEQMAPQSSPQPGWRMSFVADPEGNLLELVEPAGAVD